MRGLDRAVEDSSQIAVERVEVDLLAEPSAEGLEHARAAVAAAVEAPIDRAQDPAAGEAEERGDSERRAGDSQAGVRRERGEGELEQEHGGEVGAGQHRRQRPVDQRAVDDHVDVVEAVAKDRDRRGHRGPMPFTAQHHAVGLS